MKRTTLRLPESLYQLLTRRAEEEGVSLNHYLTYLLTRTTAMESLLEQKAQFDALRHRVPAEEAEASLEALLAARA
jgi:hypothetical protein